MSPADPVREQDPALLAASVASAVDAALSGPALVTGSLPPTGRDLDLLVAPAQCREVDAWCAVSGYARSRGRWAAFGAAVPYVVDVHRADRRRWGGWDPAVLFDGAEPLGGFDHLARPAPATVLVLAARSVVTRRGRLTEGTRARVDGALQRDADAWAAADRVARRLGLRGALRALRAAHGSLADPAPARARRLLRYLLSPDPVRVKAALVREALPRRLHPTVVSLSGLDGSGKSTQARHLREALDRLGTSSTQQWAGFATSAKLYRLCSRWDRCAWTSAGRRQLRTGPPDPFVPPGCRTGTVAPHLWVVLAAVFNAAQLWWLVLRPRPRPEVVLFDRFSPDTAVKIDYFFGQERRMDVRLARALFRLLAPRPAVGFLLAVSGEVSHARRQEHWGPAELQRMADLYERHVPRFGLRRLDGLRAAGDLHQEILQTVWRAL
ncbi:hypothetical protein [Geodermatophilus sp. URMC 62]|uniref:hypothetical protein n=1 Tax=Geodermatophilus sp. URMC 62 TaxID=3423414 RepID=UPI00406D19D1